jgi:hypothetical protein
MKYINTSKFLQFVFVSSILFMYSCRQKAESKSTLDAIKTPEIGFNEDLKNVKTFEDLVEHLNEYKSFWKSKGIDWDYVNDVAISFNNWSNSGKLNKISEDDILAIINDLPTDFDLRGVFFDIWKEGQTTN